MRTRAMLFEYGWPDHFRRKDFLAVYGPMDSDSQSCLWHKWLQEQMKEVVRLMTESSLNYGQALTQQVVDVRTEAHRESFERRIKAARQYAKAVIGAGEVPNAPPALYYARSMG
jgi:hypothetical protein